MNTDQITNTVSFTVEKIASRKWVATSDRGDRLGTFKTKADAEAAAEQARIEHEAAEVFVEAGAITKALGKGLAAAVAAAQADETTKGDPAESAEEISTASPTVVVRKAGRNWAVVVHGTVTQTFKSKAAALKEADAEADAALTRVADLAEQIETAADPQAEFVSVATAILTEPRTRQSVLAAVRPAANPISADITAALMTADTDSTHVVGSIAPAPAVEEIAPGVPADRVARLNTAQAEAKALREWKLSSATGDAPATPVIDWMAAAPAAELTRNSTSAAKAKVSADPERDAKITAIIVEQRAAGASWAAVARAIDEQGIPTARGGKWYDTTASDFAKRHGLIDTAATAA